MAQAKKRKSRKRKRVAAVAKPKPVVKGQAESSDDPKKPSRSEAKDAAARKALVPLVDGERPRAVSVAAVVAALLGLGNLVAFAAGLKIRGDRPEIVGVLAYSGLMFVAAWGAWRARYWAVLGIQALLGLLIVILSLVLLSVHDIGRGAVVVVLIAASGSLFWSLVKAMARIQMPERR